MDTLRVLLIADHFGYADGVVHGVTTYYLNVLPRLREAGVDVRCVFLRPSHPVAARLRGSGVPVEFLSAGKWDPFVLGRIERIAREMDANVLHVLGMKAALLGRLIARRSGAAVIIHSHDLNIPPGPVRLLYRMARLRRERGLAVSAAAARTMTHAYAIEATNVAVLPNGIDVSGIRQLEAPERSRDLPDTSALLAWIGRLHPVKGPQRMIRLMSGIVQQRPEARLVIVGDGPERQACVNLVRQLGLGHCVVLIGQRDDVQGILRHVQLVCITSLKEGFSLVAAEAAAVGVPVVAYSVGGLPEVVVDGQTGVLVADEDGAGFIAAVTRLLGDDAERRRLSATAWRYAGTFSIERHVEQLVAEYRVAAATCDSAA